MSTPSSEIVIAVYRPRPGQEAALRQVVKDHVPTLQRLGLATPRLPIVMTAANGTILEVFEWVSSSAIETAHSHPVVQALWQRFELAATYEPLAKLAEAGRVFAGFTPWNPWDGA
jgi:hypothetical protein